MADINEEDYFDKLLEIINKIVTVSSVYKDDNGDYQVDYGNYSPSSAEETAINDVLTNWSLNKNRFIQLDDERSRFDTALLSGYTVPTNLLANDNGGWTVSTTTDQLAVLSMQYLLAENNNASSVTVIDNTGATHTLTIADMRTFMSSYNTAAIDERNTNATNTQTINNTFNSYSGGGSYNNLIP